jgi:hypothetical protein
LELWDGNVLWTLPGDVSWVDARTLRDFPQNQEVFLGPVTRGDTFMCDLMELTGGDEQQALREQWVGLLEANEATQLGELRIFHSTISLPGGGVREGTVPCLVGRQVVEGGAEVTIWLALVRIAQVETDVLISWNQPLTALNPDSESLFKAVLRSIRWMDISFMKQ